MCWRRCKVRRVDLRTGGLVVMRWTRYPSHSAAVRAISGALGEDGSSLRRSVIEQLVNGTRPHYHGFEARRCCDGRGGVDGDDEGGGSEGDQDAAARPGCGRTTIPQLGDASAAAPDELFSPVREAELAEELLADPRVPPRREGLVSIDVLASLFAARGDGLKSTISELARCESDTLAACDLRLGSSLGNH